PKCLQWGRIATCAASLPEVRRWRNCDLQRDTSSDRFQIAVNLTSMTDIGAAATFKCSSRMSACEQEQRLCERPICGAKLPSTYYTMRVKVASSQLSASNVLEGS